MLAAATAAPAGGQPAPAPPGAWELAVTAGALHSTEDFAAVEDGWAPALGARVAWRPAPLVTVGLEAWRASLPEGPDVTAGGARMALTPWAGRGWPADPAFVFGVEIVSADDDEERGPAFVSGAGLRRDAGGWTLQAEVLHRFLTVEEPPVDGVETGRDAALWELRVAIGRILG